MHAIKLKTVIDASHRLEVDLPADTPTGEAEVIVLVKERAAAPAARSLLEFFDELDRKARPRLSAEEVDQWIESDRNAWD